MAHHILAHRQLELVARGELISRGEDCVQCSSIPPQCHCTSQDQCTYIALSCTSCPTYQCQALPSNSSSGGVSAGAVAGAVVASVVFLVVVLGAFWFYRRRLRQRQAAQSGESKSDAPARAEDVLNRPDPNEKVQEPEPPSLVRVYTGTSMGTINLDPASQGASTMQATDGHSRDSAQLNPFNDSHSIQTTSTGTRSNVIPIALVPPATFVPPTPQTNAATDGSTDRTSASAPQRPERDPSLDIGVQGIEVSHDAATKPSDELSQHTGLSNRASYLSTGSYASDLLNEAPVIVRPTRVVGVVKAEVIRTSPGNSPSKDSLRPPQAGNRPPVRSPLAASSFGPSDVLHEAPEDGQETNLPGNNPFGDEHSPSNPDSTQGSPAPSQTTFGSPSFYDDSQDHRPTSTYTQAASVIGAEIGGATRVHLGLHHLHANPPAPGEHMPRTASSGVLNSPRSAYRMTSAKLINTSPSGSAGPTGTLERQQQRAMEQITEVVPSKRTSMSSMVSTSTRADSILESFPFVPPSPISSRPIRTPPHSPLAQQPSTNANNARNASPAPASTPEPKSPPARDPPQRESLGAEQTSLPPPPRARKSRAMSVASQTSTMTNGLGSFPFQIDSGASDSGASVGSPPSSFSGRTRASLDTLALTSDLSSYPLNFDRSAPPVPRP